jgi:hypothetical protein
MLNPILVSVPSCRVTLNDAVQHSIISLAKCRFYQCCNALVAITLTHTARVCSSGTRVVALGAVLTDSARSGLAIGEA